MTPKREAYIAPGTAKYCKLMELQRLHLFLGTVVQPRTWQPRTLLPFSLQNLAALCGRSVLLSCSVLFSSWSSNFLIGVVYSFWYADYNCGHQCLIFWTQYCLAEYWKGQIEGAFDFSKEGECLVSRGQMRHLALQSRTPCFVCKDIFWSGEKGNFVPHLVALSLVFLPTVPSLPPC